MKLSRKQGSTISNTHYWVGRKNNVTFKITPIEGGGLYLMCNHNRSDAVLNTLWLPNNEGVFSSMDEARKFCENFKFQNYKEHCLRYDENKFRKG